MKTYDPKKYDLIFLGIRLNEGLADGTFIKITPTSAGFTSKSGVDGEVTRSRMHDRRRTIEFTLMQTSAINDRLSAAYNADRDSTNGEGVGAFMLQDRNGTTQVDGTAWVSQEPDLELAAEAGTRVWKLELVDGTATHGGNPSV